MTDQSSHFTLHPLRKLISVILILLLLLLVFMFLGLGLGSTGQSVMEVLSSLFTRENGTGVTRTIIWELRFPRVLLAAAVGATLGTGGLVFQALLRNPLAEPYILGISGGSAVGAVLGMLLGLTLLPGVALLSFLGSMLTLALIMVLASGRYLLKTNSLLLAGVMVNAFCSAIIMFLISVLQQTKVQSVLFWLMGDLSNAIFEQVLILVLLLIPCFVCFFLLAQTMNVLQLGSDTAGSLGVRVKRVTVILLLTTSLMVSASVCLVGLVGFVGLVIPHLLRLILGPDHRILVPACIFGGGAFMTGCDLLARTLPGQGEIPVGVVTALIGAPVFIGLLARSRSSIR